MKCEKCNEKEATFFYSSNINGEKTERCLCADCAREEGFGGALDYDCSSTGMFGSMLQDFFGSERGLLSSFGSFGLPLRSIMTPSVAIPRVNIVIGGGQSSCAREESEMKIPVDAGEDIKQRRELASLKHQLEEAVKAENFERAIELRDQIKKLESKT